MPSTSMAHLRHPSFFHLGAVNLRRVSGLVHAIEPLGEADVAGKIALPRVR